ncbi:hypothetical protein [Streptococcus sp. DD04]|uniref:hypothetical protein n=1 Tax=Streptococcus sp. DD04 TaxID=1776578 RepID=UPI000794B31B|nr:hypothetical protein [Streptococcus sp. DD04]KXT66927.1 hypothetical protein STRDD04_00308 [Streptococcus sp. DD04]
MEPSQAMRQDITQKEKEMEDLYLELQQERLKIEKERDIIMSKKRAFSDMLQEEYEMATAILRKQEWDTSVEWQVLNQYIESYDIMADEASNDQLKKLDLKDEELVENFSRQRRRLEWDIEENYRRLRESK